MTPRYMIKLEVVEIDDDGAERDIHERYATETAIADAQAADWIALRMTALAAACFGERSDCTPVGDE